MKDGADVFFHLRDLAERGMWDELRIGNTVEFELSSGPKGPIAKKIKLLEDIPLTTA
jgi:cold shock CspA family protein